MYVSRLCPAESQQQIGPNIQGLLCWCMRFPPQVPTWGASWGTFLGQAIFGIRRAISLLIGMKIYIVTDDNLADVFGP